jgi:hypothetical protein
LAAKESHDIEKQTMTESSEDVRILIEMIAKSLVDAPDEVFIETFDDGVIELEVAENDVGKVIGRQGRTARALRALLNAAGHRARKRYTLEIIE